MTDHGHRGVVRVAWGFALALAVAAVVPGAVGAASIASLDASSNTVTVIGGPEDNNISTGGGLFGTMISDNAGIVAGHGCLTSSATQVSCGATRRSTPTSAPATTRSAPRSVRA